MSDIDGTAIDAQTFEYIFQGGIVQMLHRLIYVKRCPTTELNMDV